MVLELLQSIFQRAGVPEEAIGGFESAYDANKEDEELATTLFFTYSFGGAGCFDKQQRLAMEVRRAGPGRQSADLRCLMQCIWLAGGSARCEATA